MWMLPALYLVACGLIVAGVAVMAGLAWALISAGVAMLVAVALMAAGLRRSGVNADG